MIKTNKETLDDKLDNIKLTLEDCFPCKGYDLSCDDINKSVNYFPIKDSKEQDNFLCIFKKGVRDHYHDNIKEYIDHVKDINSFQNDMKGYD